MKTMMKSQMMLMVCFTELLLRVVLLFLKKQTVSDSYTPFHKKAEKTILPTKQVKDGQLGNLSEFVSSIFIPIFSLSPLSF